MGYSTILFDLDGTLLDSLEDLKDAVNHELAREGDPLRTLEEVRSFVGNGFRMLVERALPPGRSEEEILRRTRLGELLDGVLEDVEADSEAKQAAVEEASALAQNILQETNVENLLKAKGFEESVAYITPEECSVVVAGDLGEADMLIVQEIVVEQTGLTADKIKIIGTK